jgi:3-vinyl bacteriochlorophyllide hydratase
MPSRGAKPYRIPLYTAEERRRRDASSWTRVQAILAPAQFAAFALSLVLVVRFLMSGHGETAATVSIIVKTALLAAIMATGCLWERDVFGRFLFARAFFWEDVISMAVVALHLAYLAALLSGLIAVRTQMWIALAAYAAYVINATQFLLKLRAARLEAPSARYSVALDGSGEVSAL